MENCILSVRKSVVDRQIVGQVARQTCRQNSLVEIHDDQRLRRRIAQLLVKLCLAVNLGHALCAASSLVSGAASPLQWRACHALSCCALHVPWLVGWLPLSGGKEATRCCRTCPDLRSVAMSAALESSRLPCLYESRIPRAAVLDSDGSCLLCCWAGAVCRCKHGADRTAGSDAQ